MGEGDGRVLRLGSEVSLNLSPEAYQPSDWGRAFHSLTTDEALGGGSAGPGKTAALIMEPLQQIIREHDRCARPEVYGKNALRWGQSRGWCLFLRREARMLDETIARVMRIYPEIAGPGGYEWNETKMTMKFASGYRFQFGHVKDRDDYLGYFSYEFTMLLIDEVVQLLELQYSMLKTRVRTTDPILSKMLKVRCMTNPVVVDDGDYEKDANPHWVRDYFVEPYRKAAGGIPRSYRESRVLVRKIDMDDGTWERRTRIYFPATLDDNPNPEFRRQYKINLKDQAPHIQQALLYANWYVVVGAFFSHDWQPNLHVAKPFKIPNDWIRFRSMDWGYRVAGCVHWWALDPEGTLWCEKEYTFNAGKGNIDRKTARKVAERIREIEKGMKLWKGKKSKISGPADNQLWEQRGDDGLSKAEEMARIGVSWIPADKRSEVRSAERVSERLRDHDHGTKTPGLVFFESCVEAIASIPAIPADSHDQSVPAQKSPLKHWYDSVKYACAYASRRDLHRHDDPDDADTEEDDDVTELDKGYDGYGSTI